jgi:hypothetical protein
MTFRVFKIILSGKKNFAELENVGEIGYVAGFNWHSSRDEACLVSTGMPFSTFIVYVLLRDVFLGSVFTQYSLYSWIKSARLRGSCPVMEWKTSLV